jgi:multiple sugar transport system permease protein
VTATATPAASAPAPGATASASAPGATARAVRRWFPLVVMVALLIYFLIPLVWLGIAATKTNSDLFGSFGFWFGGRFALFDNLADLFARDGGVFTTWLQNTVIYALAASIGGTLICTLAGYAFAMYRFRGRGTLYAIVLASVFVPSTVLAVPLYFMISESGLSNTLLAIILPSLVFPFGVFLMRVYAEASVPDELLDAARVDGAGETRIFASIAFRLLMPGVVTVLLFSFVNAWNNFFLPLLVLSRSELFPVTVGLSNWWALATQPGNVQTLYALVVTGSVVAILPVMILFLFLQRYWQQGLTLGSIRG